jgi:hypothetical protein
LKCKEGRIVPDLKIDHSFDVEVPIDGWVANVDTLPSAFLCLDVLAHTKSPVWEFDMINDNTQVDAVLIADRAERTLDTASALMMFTNLGCARKGHSLGKRREAG